MKIGCIGAGNMGMALIKGFLSSGLISAQDIWASDRSESRLKDVQAETGIHVSTDNVEVVNAADMILLAIKPQVAPSVYPEIAAYCADKPVLSIVTGATTEILQNNLPKARVCRMMPNTPALVGEGVLAISEKHTFTAAEIDFAQKLLTSTGKVVFVQENWMSAVVGVSGSSPAYLFMVIEAMADGGVRQGLPRKLAMEMAAQAVIGAGKMVLESRKHPGELKDEVCSPGGTTIEAVRTLENKGLRSAVMEAVICSSERAQQMEK